MVGGCLDGDRTAVAVAQHVGSFLTVVAIADHPGLVELIVYGLRCTGEHQRNGW